MKVVFLVRSVGAGGAEHQLLVLAGGLHRRGHDVGVIVLQGGGELEQEFKASGADVRIISRSRWWLPLAILRLPLILRSLAPDVVHGYLPVGNCLSVSARLFVPRARVVFGVRGASPERIGGGWAVRLFYRVEALCSSLADAIITNSRAARSEVARRGFPIERLHVIPNGIDVHRFTPDAVARKALRHQWSVGEDEIVVARVGGLRPIKDYPTFLRAAAMLVDDLPQARYVCVGGGPTEDLSRLATSIGLGDKVSWLGHRADIPAVMSAIDILVSSSVSESFPNVVAEAMACGVPCIVTDVGESAWIVGETGEVVPVSAPGAMANAIRSVAVRLAAAPDEIRPQARRRIVEQFGVESMVEQTEHILASCAGR